MADRVQDILDRHRRAGVFFEQGGVRSFRLEQGSGRPIVLFHGVPASCYLYRKMIPLLGENFRALAFDLPGLGLADRPENFDYSFHGLASFCAGAIRSLQLKNIHFVIHDIGGPVGLLAAALLGSDVTSVTILNTPLQVASFSRPWMMAPFAMPGVGEIWLAAMNRFSAGILFRREGILQPEKTDPDEIAAYADLLKMADGGRAFLRIMRSFSLDESTEKMIIAALKAIPRRQLIWAENDAALPWKTIGRGVAALTEMEEHLIPGKHFFQEDQPEKLAALITDFLKS